MEAPSGETPHLEEIEEESEEVAIRRGTELKTLKLRAGILIGILALVNVVLIATGLIMSIPWPSLLSSCLLSYTFGLRHALDADHLAAIDNVSRRLMQDGKLPVTVGFWFSLGHSTVVFILTILVIVASTYVQNNLTDYEEIGAIIGTSISAAFLIFIGLLNLWVFFGVMTKIRKLRKKQEEMEKEKQGVTFHNEEPYEDPLQSINTGKEATEITQVIVTTEETQNASGFFLRCCPKLLNLINEPWKMYPVGFLFGLGFDTASEVALLALAALAPGDGVPPVAVLILPGLFTAGMALIDTLDGIGMVYAYKWAFQEPDTKLIYNAFITLLSLLIAFGIGGLEILSVIASSFSLTGPFWTTVADLNFGWVGLIIISVFVISFLVSYILWRTKKKKPHTDAAITEPEEVKTDEVVVEGTENEKAIKNE